MSHPSKDLKIRQGGYGIAAGLEKPYNKGKLNNNEDKIGEQYGAMPHSGYYGMGLGTRPFKEGQASYTEEIVWYRLQYGV